MGRTAAQTIIAETGVDMTAFPTPGHLASWAKLTPRTIQSGAKSGHGCTGTGNRRLKGPLGEAAVCASRTSTFPGARYRETVFQIEVEDTIGEQLLGRVDPLVTRMISILDRANAMLVERDTELWAHGEIDPDEPAT